MHIKNISIQNYKSFNAPPMLELTTGFNIVTGSNNAGKTALLEALSLNFEPNPHRSATTIPTRTSTPNPTSSVMVTLAIEQVDLSDLFNRPGTVIQLPLPAIGGPFADEIGYLTDDENNYQRLLTWFLEKEEFEISVRLDRFGGNHDVRLPRISIVPIEQIQRPNNYRVVDVEITANRTHTFRGPVTTSEPFALAASLFSEFRSTVYAFKAERLNVGTCRFGNSMVLATDASNLAEALNSLQDNVARFERFNTYVRQVFPQIQRISVRPYRQDGSMVQIVVWNHDPNTERDDLAVPLSQSGTGIGQVLAILYVVLTSDSPRTIIIVEPQSFLHPGAVRKLIEIFKQHSQHQFIVSTHAPSVISAASPQTITAVQYADAESTLQVIDTEEHEALRTHLADIGARLGDVFGADNILWVEGDTEELAFPKIVDALSTKHLMGTVIRGVRSTGDLEGKHAELVIDVYVRLSHANSLLPPALAFVFDDEGRTAQQKQELRTRSHEKAHFLPRRLYENYLLNPTAVAAVANSIEGFRGTSLTPEEVQAWYDSRGREARFGTPRSEGEAWTTYVHGAKVLDELFSELSETRVSFSKTTHSVALTEWIIANAPEDLRELVDFLDGLLE